MRNLCLLGVVVAIITLGSVTVWCCHSKKAAELPTSNVSSEEFAQLDPVIQVLLKETAKNDIDHNSQFFTTLSELAKKNGLSLKDYVSDRFVDEGYAVCVRAGSAPHPSTGR